MESRRIKGEIEVTVPCNEKHKERKAVLSIRFSELQLKALSYRKSEKLLSIKVYAVLAREESAPEGQEAIEWLLLTTVPVNSFDDAVERVSWYACRWMIEIYHKVLKSGCKIEERQFEDAKRIERYLTIDGVVAWRVLGLRFQCRETPDMSCEAFTSTSGMLSLPKYSAQV